MSCKNSNLEFRKIPSLKFLYEVNENGTIFRNVKSKKQLKIKLDYHHSKVGYYTTFVHVGGRGPDSRTIRVPIHRVVAECWLGPCPEGKEVDHKDRNAHNNHYTNLRYVVKSEQMKNRDHSNIIQRGTLNLSIARAERMNPVRISGLHGFSKTFDSYAECSRFLGWLYAIPVESVRYRLKRKSKHIRDFDVFYLNAETRHGSSTEQGIVH